MVELRHIRVNYTEAINAKRNLLSAQINSLELIKKIKSYRMLRKEESNIKIRLKKEISSIKSALAILESNMPRDIKELEIEETGNIREIEKERRINVNSDLKNELDEIKRKLASLNS